MQENQKTHTHVDEEQVIKETWSKLWASKQESAQNVDAWDSLSEIVLATLLHECGGRQGLRLVEAGCGTGRICRELLNEKMNVACLDISPQALELARAQIGDGAEYILGSILDMPKRDRSGIRPFDIVWNSGVMEHFSESDQEKALREFALSLKAEDGSRVITLTPYSRSLLYRIGKLILEKMNKWPFGREIPVTTLKNVCPSELEVVREYSVAFLPLLLDAYKWVPPLRWLGRASFFLLRKGLGRTGLRLLDRWMSRVWGGYLLVTVFRLRKDTKSPATLFS